MRIDASLRAARYGGRRELSAVKAIVFHFTANRGLTATARQNAIYFANGAEGRAASAHYVVDSGATVYECVPIDCIAWAVGDGSSGTLGKFYNNYNTVSIEMVSCSDENGYFIPEATQIHAAALYRQLKKTFPDAIPIRHYDISGKLCPLPMVSGDKWDDFKRRLEDDQLDMTRDELLSTAGTGDNPSDWAKPATDWAKENKIFNGDAHGNFGWQQPITREQLAQVLYNMANK